MKFGLLQPRARRIKFKVASRAHNRKGGVRQGKRGISIDRMAQVLSGFVEHRWITRRTEPVTSYEFRVGHGVLAVSRAALDYCRNQRAVQCHGDLLRYLVLKVG